jgi:hypothetical protein
MQRYSYERAEVFLFVERANLAYSSFFQVGVLSLLVFLDFAFPYPVVLACLSVPCMTSVEPLHHRE